MSFLNLFNKNPNQLKNQSEKDVALCLRGLIREVQRLEIYKKSGAESYVTEEIMHYMETLKVKENELNANINQLALHIYYLSFKRTSKKSYNLEILNDPLEVIRNSKSLEYLAVYKSIRNTLENVIKNPMIILIKDYKIEDAEKATLGFIEEVVNSINKI